MTITVSSGPALQAGEVHVWHVDLRREPGLYEQLLSTDERERAARFHFERDRRRYAVERGILRLLLARYLDEAPEDIVFEYGPHGRPELDGLSFNVSHSGDTAIVAVSLDGDVGIDIEELRSEPAREHVAERFFSPREVATLRSLPLEEQAQAFLACWTRKEAFIKALGDGLSLALDSFDVTLRPGEAPALTRTAWSPSEPARWSFADLSDHVPGHVAALATRGAGANVVVGDWID